MADNGLPAVVRQGGLTEVRGRESPALHYLVGLQSQGTRVTMRRRLDALAQLYFHSRDCLTCEWHLLQVEDLRKVVAGELYRGKSVAFTNLSLAALRGVATAAFELRQISADRYMKLRLAKQARGGSDDPAGRYLSRKEREDMIASCPKTPMGRRDAAILLVMIGLGLRRSEVVAMDRADLAEERIGGARVYEVTVKGKGCKRRKVFADNGVFWALHDWLAVRGDEEIALFCAGHKSGRLYPKKRLGQRGLYSLFLRRAKDAGVPNATPHDCRRSLCSDLLDAGVDLATVSLIFGHSDPRTTARYDRRGERAKKRAAGTLTWAYERA